MLPVVNRKHPDALFVGVPSSIFRKRVGVAMFPGQRTSEYKEPPHLQVVVFATQTDSEVLYEEALVPMATDMTPEVVTDEDRLQLMEEPLRRISQCVNGMHCYCEVTVVFVVVLTITMFENFSFRGCGNRSHPWNIIEAKLKSGISTTKMIVKMSKESSFHRCVSVCVCAQHLHHGIHGCSSTALVPHLSVQV